MISFRVHHRFPLLSLAAAAMLTLSAGCSRLLPARHGSIDSAEVVLDTRRDPSATLSGRFIPGIVPGVTKIPVFFDEKVPTNAVFTDVTCEIVHQTGEPLAVLTPTIEHAQVFLSFASANTAAVSEVHVVVHAKYRYGW
jgi:hypothetical protein